MVQQYIYIYILHSLLEIEPSLPDHVIRIVLSNAYVANGKDVCKRHIKTQGLEAQVLLSVIAMIILLKT